MPKIGIIQHNDAIRNMYHMKFELAGFGVQSAATGPLGIELWKSFHPDLILLDLHLPFMNGFEVLRHITEAGEQIFLPKVLLTSNGDPYFISKKFPGVHKKDIIIKAHHTPSQILAIVKDIIGNSK